MCLTLGGSVRDRELPPLADHPSAERPDREANLAGMTSPSARQLSRPLVSSDWPATLVRNDRKKVAVVGFEQLAFDPVLPGHHGHG
jgi:hypothetical protein